LNGPAVRLPDKIVVDAPEVGGQVLSPDRDVREDDPLDAATVGEPEVAFVRRAPGPRATPKGLRKRKGPPRGRVAAQHGITTRGNETREVSMRVIQNFSIHHTAGPRSIGWNPEFSGGQFLNGGALTSSRLAACHWLEAPIDASTCLFAPCFKLAILATTMARWLIEMRRAGVAGGSGCIE